MASTSAPPPAIGRLDGAGGSGSLYHVAAIDQGLHLEPETLSYWGYDDGTSTLLVAKGGMVFAYDMSPPAPYSGGAGGGGGGGAGGGAAPAAPGSGEQLRWTFPLADGPPVRALRMSLDGGLLAIQRSPVMLEFVELATGNVFVQGTDRGRSEILSFFFTELEGADLVLVTPAGLEMLEFVPRRQGLRLRERVRLPVEWALYTHETRMVLLGTTAGGSSYIKAYQFVSSGLVALPAFTAGAAASALVLMGTATGGGGGSGALVAGSPAAAAAVATPPARVGPDCLRLIKVYGRVYCAHINRRTLKLELYRFYTDTVVLQHTYELFSPSVELAVVDSVIVAHCGAAAARVGGGGGGGGGGGAAAASAAAPLLAGVAMLFDVAAPTLQPIANPLPLRLLRHGGAPSEAEAADADAGSTNGSGKRRWEYLAPNVVLDRSGQTAYRLALNLAAVAESCSEPAVLVGFLQRRRGPPPLPPSAASGGASGLAAAAAQLQPQPSPKALLMAVVRNALQERMPLPTIRAIFEDLCAGYAAALDRELAPLPPPSAAAAGAAASPPPAPPLPPLPPTAVPMPQYVTSEELATDLFRWLHDEEVVDAPYLQAALWEYMSAAFGAGIPLPPYLQELSVEILLQQSQEGQVLQLLYSQADYVSPDMTERLLATAPQKATSPPTPTVAAAEAAAAAATADAVAGDDGEAAGGGAGALPPQLRLDALSRAALPARYEPVAAAAAGAASAASASSSAAADASAYVEALLAAGEVLRAARVMRRYRVSRPSVKEFIAAVGARGDEATLAAVYRTFQDELLASYPKFDLAARKLLPTPATTAAPSAATSAA